MRRPDGYTVTGNIGSYVQGQVVINDADVAAYYRAVLNEGADRESTLTDEQILKVVHEIDGDSEDAEVERIEKLEFEVA